MLTLTPEQRRALRAEAHTLHPVVAIAGNGLSEAVLKEVDRSLRAHGLIKVRVYEDDRQAREACLAALCEKLDCAPVQHIGKLLILWRPVPEKRESVKKNRILGRRPALSRVAAAKEKRRPFAGQAKRIRKTQGRHA
jgi:putative YhbY family RNA-binding protein